MALRRVASTLFAELRPGVTVWALGHATKDAAPSITSVREVMRLGAARAPLQRALSTTQRKPAIGMRGPITFQYLIYALIVGAGVVSATKAYNDQKVQQVMRDSQKVAGKAAVGGPFTLINQDGKAFSDKDLLGEFAVLYFGFTHCPDICPDELEKLSASMDLVEKKSGRKVNLVFISVDPERDTPAKVKSYVREFHPRMIGLTGDIETVKTTSKQYRVFYHKTDEGADDYLVDHSIIHYLLNPEGDFVTFYGKNYTAEQMADSICENITNWQKEHPDYVKA